MVLNPSVHYQKLSFPIYKKELSDAIDLIKDLRALSISVKTLLIDTESTLIFKHPSQNYTFEFSLKQKMIRGDQENPLCIIKTWQYKDIEFYDFINNNHGNPPKQKECRFNKMIDNLSHVPGLNITREMFIKNTTIGKGTLEEALS